MDRAYRGVPIVHGSTSALLPADDQQPAGPHQPGDAGGVVDPVDAEGEAVRGEGAQDGADGADRGRFRRGDPSGNDRPEDEGDQPDRKHQAAQDVLSQTAGAAERGSVNARR